MEFPRLVYKSPSTHVLVSDQDGLDAALSEGWFASVPEALKAKHAVTGGAVPVKVEAAPEKEPEPEEPAKPTREALEAQANELGVEFRSNISDEKLAERIADKLATADA